MWTPDISGGFDGTLDVLGWKLNKDQLSVVITCAIVIIVLISITIVFMIWYCFFYKKKKKNVQEPRFTLEEQIRANNTMPCFSKVLVDPKTGGISYNSHIIELFPEREGSPDNWFFNDQDEEQPGVTNYTNKVPRSASVPPAKQLQSFDPSMREIKEFVSDESLNIPNLDDSDNGSDDGSENGSDNGSDNSSGIGLDNMTQFVTSYLPSSVEICEIMEPEVFFNDRDPVTNNIFYDGKVLTLRTRSLPIKYVRNKKRPFSTSDNLSELYAKVNFSKKRKNRMRNDEAAIIAMSKSRSQFLSDKDTDILVDNEAVIVYDERTAL